MTSPALLWVGFNLLILCFLAVDLLVDRKKESQTRGFKQAMLWSAAWIGVALLFNLGIYAWSGKEPALEFLTGYLIEKSLSVDNLFVFLMLFSAFRVSLKYQHKVLFWGILGALVMRAIFIFAGIELMHRFHWIIYLFGVFLIYTGIKMALPKKEQEKDLSESRVIALLKRIFPVTSDSHEGRFTVRKNGKFYLTSLFLCLVVIEVSDLVFALDSIPAVLAVTPDPFIVYSSNVFAILGLRALYFALSGVIQVFSYLHYGLSAILVFVGAKMVLKEIYDLPTGVALAVIFALLLLSVAASILWPKKVKRGAA